MPCRSSSIQRNTCRWTSSTTNCPPVGVCCYQITFCDGCTRLDHADAVDSNSCRCTNSLRLVLQYTNDYVSSSSCKSRCTLPSHFDEPVLNAKALAHIGRWLTSLSRRLARDMGVEPNGRIRVKADAGECIFVCHVPLPPILCEVCVVSVGIRIEHRSLDHLWGGL